MDTLHDKYIRAGSTSTSVEELALLASDEVDNVRRRVGENLQTPVEILLLLAVDENPDVRVAVGENPLTPPSVLEQLAQDNDVDVRYALAENPTLSIGILTTLIEDENPYVSHRARRTWRMIQPPEIRKLPENEDLGSGQDFNMRNIKSG